MPHENRSPAHLPGLDLLRGLAILLVISWHYPRADAPDFYEKLSIYGWTGVDLFFVLSGFLIGGQLLGSAANGEKIDFSRFYLRRAFRILPSFWAVLAIYLFLPSWRERELLTPGWRFLTFTQNFGLRFNAFSHAWSLCVEEHFYLLLPILVVLLRGIGWKRLGALSAAIVVGGVVLRAVIWRHLFAGADPDSPAWYRYDTFLYYPTYCRLDGLTVGVVLAALRIHRPQIWAWLQARAWLPALLGTGFLSVAGWLCHDRTSFQTSTAVFPLLSLGYGSWLVAMSSPLFAAGARVFPACTAWRRSPSPSTSRTRW